MFTGTEKAEGCRKVAGVEACGRSQQPAGSRLLAASSCPQAAAFRSELLLKCRGNVGEELSFIRTDGSQPPATCPALVQWKVHADGSWAGSGVPTCRWLTMQ